MNAESEVRTAPSINGHMIALGTEQWIAVYERNQESYVAEFRQGRGGFTPAGLWFRLDAGCLRYRLAAVRAATALTREMLENIERLHREDEAREQRTLALPRSVAAAARRYWISVLARLRSAHQTLG